MELRLPPRQRQGLGQATVCTGWPSSEPNRRGGTGLGVPHGRVAWVYARRSTQAYRPSYRRWASCFGPAGLPAAKGEP